MACLLIVGRRLNPGRLIQEIGREVARGTNNLLPGQERGRDLPEITVGAFMNFRERLVHYLE